MASEVKPPTGPNAPFAPPAGVKPKGFEGWIRAHVVELGSLLVAVAVGLWLVTRSAASGTPLPSILGGGGGGSSNPLGPDPTVPTPSGAGAPAAAAAAASGAASTAAAAVSAAVSQARAAVNPAPADVAPAASPVIGVGNSIGGLSKSGLLDHPAVAAILTGSGLNPLVGKNLPGAGDPASARDPAPGPIATVKAIVNNLRGAAFGGSVTDPTAQQSASAYAGTSLGEGQYIKAGGRDTSNDPLGWLPTWGAPPPGWVAPAPLKSLRKAASVAPPVPPAAVYTPAYVPPTEAAIARSSNRSGPQ